MSSGKVTLTLLLPCTLKQIRDLKTGPAWLGRTRGKLPGSI